MPRSIFLGRVPQPGEPLWLDEDRAWAIALLAEQRDACPGCGQPRSETFDPANAYAYGVKRLGVCAGCYVKDFAAKDELQGSQFRVYHKPTEGDHG